MQGVLRRCGLVDGYAKVRTPIGDAYVATTERGIAAVMEARSDAEFERRYRERFGRRSERRQRIGAQARAPSSVIPKASWSISAPVIRFNARCSRRLVEFPPVRYAPTLGSRVRSAIREPWRAVGTALARNPVPLIVPCHRVVRSDGEAGHYAPRRFGQSALAGTRRCRPRRGAQAHGEAPLLGRGRRIRPLLSLIASRRGRCGSTASSSSSAWRKRAITGLLRAKPATRRWLRRRLSPARFHEPMHRRP